MIIMLIKNSIETFNRINQMPLELGFVVKRPKYILILVNRLFPIEVFLEYLLIWPYNIIGKISRFYITNC